MKYKTPPWQMAFYQDEDQRGRKRKTAPAGELLVAGNKIVAINDDEAKLIPSESKRKCKHCGAPVCSTSYFYCKKHKPTDDGGFDGNLIYAGVSGEH
jgi:hypothetical protein